MSPLLDSDGRPWHLGVKLGRGGEATVYEIAGAQQQHFVAKVYHETPLGDRQTKLKLMVLNAQPALMQIATWPLKTLHSYPNGPVVGFVMRKVSGNPAHELYSPIDRRRFFPKARWDYQVHVAINMARAVCTVHAHNQVIGDINANLMYIAADGTVKLIDCDSFQISHSASGQHFRCLVGVPDYTPPELIGKSFAQVNRTPNHDAFGLAVLIFQVLLHGRHPFAGVYHQPVHPTLPEAIQRLEYAYARHAAQYGLSPPANAVTPGILPARVVDMFECAFGALGKQARPQAADWVKALTDLELQLRTCPHPHHRYYQGLATCPWCTLDRLGITYFVPAQVMTARVSGFDLEVSWGRIVAVISPGPAPAVQSHSLNLVATPFVPPVGHNAPALPLAILHDNEKLRREKVMIKAHWLFNKLEAEWKRQAGDEAYRQGFAELTASREDYLRLKQDFARDKQALWQGRRASQLEKYLANVDITYVTCIPGLGPTRRAMLSANNITTAADLDLTVLLQLPRFGQVTVAKLMDWRMQCELGFCFNPALGVDPADLAKLDTAYATRRVALEQDLVRGPAKLESVKRQILARRVSMQPQLNAAYRDYAQAKLDYDSL